MYKKKYKEQIESLPESQRKKYKKYYYSEESKFITGDIGLGLSLFSPINIFISIFTQTIPIIISSAILVFQLINLLYWFSLRKKVPEGLVVKNQSIRDGYSIRSYCANNILWYGISFYSFLVSIRKITGIGFLKAIPFALVLYSFFELLFPNTYAYEHGALFSTKSHFGKECKTDKIVSILNLSTGIILSVLVLCI